MGAPAENVPPPTPEELARAKAEKQAKFKAEFDAAMGVALSIVEPATREWWKAMDGR